MVVGRRGSVALSQLYACGSVKEPLAHGMSMSKCGQRDSMILMLQTCVLCFGKFV